MPILATRTGMPTQRIGNGRAVTAPPVASGSPLAPEIAKAAGANLYGFCSIEDFPPGINDLTYTHEDAGGFYAYVKQFAAPNFWYQDANVLSWIYGEQYDDWQNTYGFDACLVEYHSGHGGMDANGVFSMPMGGTWGNTAWVSSTDMRLGNEAARYLFFSTCESLRVNGGQSPLRTWGAANLGVRMIFGFESVSVDDPNYGKNFWQKWNQDNRSFSKAWLDASWQISTHQAPSAAACGATQDEARTRVGAERLFSGDRASTAWWWWVWYDAAKAITPRSLVLPSTPGALRLAPVDAGETRARELADRFGVGGAPAESRAAGTLIRSADGGPTLAVHEGGYDVRFAESRAAGGAPGDGPAVSLAQQAVEAFGLAADVDLVVDSVRRTWEAGASADEQVAPAALETHVVFAQVVDGMPITTPGTGEVRVTVDGTGTVVAITDATRRVEDLDTSPRPPEPASRGTAARRARSASSADELLAVPRERLLRRLATTGPVPAWSRAVADSTDVGFVVRGDRAIPAVRQTLEVDCGEGLAKRFALEAPVTD